ncbi:5-methylcytosine-specific restriction protein A [Rhodococcus sp. 27YEA15]|uniref:HNH endonuclease n=1 Tax=Rhodococcus sp. 27YEA15 TaxID=3156259 RepID=UPI003C7C6E2C
MAWGHGGTSDRTSRSEHRRWRRAVLTRDQYRCRECGYQGSPQSRPADVQADHIINHAEGGPTTLPNGQTLCRPCHGRKTQREAQAGRAKNGRLHPVEPHPGLL